MEQDKQILYYDNLERINSYHDPIDNENIESNENGYHFSWIEILSIILLVLLGSASIIFLSLGKTSFHWIPNCTSYDDVTHGRCYDVLWVWLAILISLIFIFFWHFPLCINRHIFCCGSYHSKPFKYQYFLSMLIIFLLWVTIVMLAHGIGYGIGDMIFDIKEFFTPITLLIGFIFYGILFLLFAILSIIAFESGRKG